MSKKNPLEWPYYGPVGDPDSTDPFEWMQARAPEGWHVEGQYLGGYEARSLHDERLSSATKRGLVDAMVDAGSVR